MEKSRCNSACAEHATAERALTLRIEARRKPVKRDLQYNFLLRASIGRIGRERMPVHDAEEALIRILHLDPVFQSADVVGRGAAFPVGRIPLSNPFTRLDRMSPAIRRASTGPAAPDRWSARRSPSGDHECWHAGLTSILTREKPARAGCSAASAVGAQVRSIWRYARAPCYHLIFSATRGTARPSNHRRSDAIAGTNAFIIRAAPLRAHNQTRDTLARKFARHDYLLWLGHQWSAWVAVVMDDWLLPGVPRPLLGFVIGGACCFRSDGLWPASRCHARRGSEIAYTSAVFPRSVSFATAG